LLNVTGVRCRSLFYRADLGCLFLPQSDNGQTDYRCRFRSSYDLVNHAVGPILGFLGMALLLVALSTAYDYFILKFIPRFKSDIIDETHTYLQKPCL
jgi:hypothetical protein